MTVSAFFFRRSPFTSSAPEENKYDGIHTASSDRTEYDLPVGRAGIGRPCYRCNIVSGTCFTGRWLESRLGIFVLQRKKKWNPKGRPCAPYWRYAPYLYTHYVCCHVADRALFLSRTRTKFSKIQTQSICLMPCLVHAAAASRVAWKQKQSENMSQS